MIFKLADRYGEIMNGDSRDEYGDLMFLAAGVAFGIEDAVKFGVGGHFFVRLRCRSSVN